MRYFPIVLSLAAASCATVPDRTDGPRLPTAAEVASNVERTWESDGWGTRFAREASRPGESATLIGVDNVRCDYYYGTPDCTLDVTGRFASGETVTRNLGSSFDWENGQLVGVLVTVHTRPNSN